LEHHCVKALRRSTLEWPPLRSSGRRKVKTWLAGVLAMPEGEIGLRLDFDYNDAPVKQH